MGLPSTPWQQRGWPVPQGHPVPKGCPCHKEISVPRGHPVLDGGPVPKGHPALHGHPLPKGCPVPKRHPIPKRHPSLDGGPLSKGFSVPTEHPVPMGCPLPVRCPVPTDVLSEMGLPSPQPHSTGRFPPCSHHGTAEHAQTPRGTPSSPEGLLLTRPWPPQCLHCTPSPRAGPAGAVHALTPMLHCRKKGSRVTQGSPVGGGLTAISKTGAVILLLWSKNRAPKCV